ncbi:MAG: hypothetical protein NTY77_08805 [Elusimicrobia bacterium]|nr:hypothetical protein [Elusimicrobiota bacterium]
MKIVYKPYWATLPKDPPRDPKAMSDDEINSNCAILMFERDMIQEKARQGQELSEKEQEGLVEIPKLLDKYNREGDRRIDEANPESGPEAPQAQEKPAGPSEETLQAMEQQDPGAASLIRARQDMQSGDLSGAVSHLDSAAGSSSNDPKLQAYVLSQRGKAEAMLGRTDAARQDLAKALALNPKDASAAGLAKLLEHRNIPKDSPLLKTAGFGPAKDAGAMPEGAVKAQAMSRGPAPAPPAPGLPSGPPQAHAGDPGVLVREAASKLSLGDYEGSIRSASLAIDSGAKGPAPYVIRGKAQSALGREAEAVKDQTSALEQEADAALEASLERAWSEASEKDYEKARMDADAAARINPGVAGSKKYKDIDADITGASAQVPWDGAAHPGAGRVAAAEGLSWGIFSSALPETAAGISPESMRLAREAQARLSVGDYLEAIRLAGRALYVDGKNYYAYIIRACAQRLCGRFRAAIDDATSALALQPQAADALLARSLAYLHLKDWKQAAADASAAIRLAPQREDAYRQRALARKMTGDTKGEQEDLRQAESLAAAHRGQKPRGLPKAAVLALSACGGLIVLGACFRALRGNGVRS